MKRLMILSIAILICVAPGCEEPKPRGAERNREINQELVKTYRDLAIKNALIAQHTIYPYQFKPNSADLNDLGLRDLEILAEHYREYPGELNVRQQGTEYGLYQERVNRVRDQLARHGVDTSRMQIVDVLPGGDGMPSREVLSALQDKDSNSDSYPASTTVITTGTGK